MLIVLWDDGNSDVQMGWYMLWTGERGIKGESKRFRKKMDLLTAWVKDELIFKL